MKLKNIKYVAGAMLLAMGMTSCEDFLDRPVEDNYNTDNYYVSDNAVLYGTSYLYNSPWYDFQRGFIKVAKENVALVPAAALATGDPDGAASYIFSAKR